MTVWAQSSQRATWPPSAAVRQFPIADFNWPRLTWPALASRQARAMGAEDIRDLQDGTRHGKRASCGRFMLCWVQAEPTQRARHVADRVDGDARIERSRIELGVSEQNLDNPNVDVLFEQMRGEAVPLCGDTRLAIPAVCAAA
jgi:hypothetical protein